MLPRMRISARGAVPPQDAVGISPIARNNERPDQSLVAPYPIDREHAASKPILRGERAKGCADLEANSLRR